MTPWTPTAPGRRLLAAVAMVGVVCYVLVDVVLQLLPPHYSPISDSESHLAVGPYGWVMNLNFLGRAATTFCAVAAIGRFGPASGARRTGLVLMTVAGVCSAVLAFFATDVPAGDATGIETETALGVVHLSFASLGFLAALAAFALLTWWIRSSRELGGAYPAALALVLVAGLGLVSLAACAALAPGLLGLAERVCLAGVLGWVFVVCAAIRRAGQARGLGADILKG